MESLSTELFALLIVAAFAAGFIDSIAGGGGLITIPALLLAGFPPVLALGTNKLQGMFGSGSSTLAYARKGHVNLREQGLPALLSGIGAVLGSLLAAYIPGELMRAVLPLLLVAIALYFLLRKGMGDEDRQARMKPALFIATLVPAIGFYDGLFGPGTGSFFMLAFVSLAGYGMLKATAHTKLLNFASNIGSFATFALLGAINWQVGLAMGMAQFLGAQTGSNLAMKRGSKIIRPLLVLTCVALAAKLLSDPAYPLWHWF